MSEGPGGYLICGYCGCGCGLHLDYDGAGAIGVIPSNSHPVSGGRLCRRGWTIHRTLADSGRIRAPLAKGKREIGWDESFALAASKLKSTPPQQIGIIASPTSTNESLFLLGKLARAVLGTNNIDFPGRQAVVPTQILLSKVGEIACTISDLDGADLIITIGLSDEDRAPQIAPRIWNAIRRGAAVLAVDGRPGDLFSEAALVLSPKPHTDHAWIEAVGARLSPRFPTSGSAEEKRAETGIPAEAIEKTAALIRDAKRIAWIYDASALGRLADARSIVALSRLLGWCRSEKEWVGVLPIVERNNTLGALDMGIAPDLLPGWRSIRDRAAARKVEGEWHVQIPQTDGLDLRSMIDAATHREIRCLLVVGDLGSCADPSAEEIRRALRELEFLIAIESFPSPLTENADLILARLLPGEVKGTYTSTEGRIQATHSSLPSRNPQEWTIFAEIAERLGADWGYGGLEPVMDEIGRLVPEYAEAKAAPPQGVVRSLWGDDAFDSVEEPRPIPVETADTDFPLVLCVERTYQPFHMDSDLLRSPLMRRELAIQPNEPHIFLNPDDARAAKIRDGAKATLRSRAGAGSVRVRCDSEIARGSVILPEIYHGAMGEVLGERPVDAATGRRLYPARAVTVQAN